MLRRRTIAALLALYSLVVASGAPLPLAWTTAWARPAVAEGQRFPCEACPCGCGTAEHCWGACCCHTLPERLAWARREGVRPPESALDDAQRAGLDIREWRAGARYVVRLPMPAEDEKLPPCCRKARACCQAKAPASSNDTAQTKKPSQPGVALIKAMACQGIADVWFAFGQAPLVTGPQLVVDTPTVYAVEGPAPLWRSWTPEPASPPPRRLA
ncbi:hypothetical protein Pla108_26380 [Botrimarina colliarenosi]|uniref:Uncharacterized protein n=1 Tax=Botrimarina colliarenosi TaxID=2528001 RepID=A0A5C6AF64_9BACT|nr:hypothetical protein [Botrimarina colliarenosi]TWT96863.1 hypothetical protein Pla108_26380 [Botrimarina colliarenosi]